MNIFISNLTDAITDGDLKDLFGEYGEVSSAKVIKDRETNKSRGFGFVEMSDEPSAKKAILELDAAEYDGKIIRINEARPKEGKGAGGNKRRF